MDTITDVTTTNRTVSFPVEANLSWVEFKTFVSEKLFPDNNEGISGAGAVPAARIPRYLFRGHGDEQWNLIPSFDRTFESLDDDERDEKHGLLIKYFVDECVHYPEYKDDLKDEFQKLALAQHHGLPTRLLDWTDSPYVAAYYAFSKHLKIDRGKGISGRENTVAVWILDTNAPGYWKGKGVSVISPTPLHNERQKSQSGWFTYATMTHRTVEEYVLAIAKGKSQNALRKFTLSAGEAGLALRDLNFMGINARVLSADLDGAAINALVRAVLA